MRLYLYSIGRLSVKGNLQKKVAKLWFLLKSYDLPKNPDLIAESVSLGLFSRQRFPKGGLGRRKNGHLVRQVIPKA